MQKAFNIPGINNRLEALAKYLGVNTDIESELSTIEVIYSPTTPGVYVHKFKYHGVTYFVANNSYGLAADKVVQFNSSFWSIMSQKQNSPYLRFYDEKVIKQLCTILPEGYRLLAINQQIQKILCRKNGFLVVMSYTSHFPEQIESYYLRGSVQDGLRDVKNYFSDKYAIKLTDKMLHDKESKV